MKSWYQQTEGDILENLHVTKDGHTPEAAAELLESKGENVLEAGKRKSTLQVFLSQFADLLVIILIIAAVISAFTGSGESTIVIIAVIILNAILGTVQHKKAEKSLDSLKSLSSPSAKVIRGGRKIEIASKDVVPGDILLLEAGDLVVADGRVLNGYSLQVNESSLTGESTSVDKAEGLIEGEVPLAERSQYGLFQQPGDLWAGRRCGDGNRDGYGNREDCRSYECNKGKKDAAAGESG